jgi:2-oxoglutarate ferredoxin oxidoreductase subunit alpha
MREYTDGATVIARAALRAGCTFFAGYPITPATSILLHMIRELPKTGGVALQAEDEIGSISMCVGAAMAGAKAMTATSGPGISLYSENIGLAIMGEVPLVIVDVMRLGPATGGATTGAQDDVQFVRWGTSGGYPIIALAPSSLAECCTLTQRAFNLAERFRCPVFLLADKELVLGMGTMESGDCLDEPRVERLQAEGDSFVPYLFDPIDSVPPFVPLGGEHTVRFTGSTHDEGGMLSKNPEKVGRLNEHLWRKICDHRDEIISVRCDIQPGARSLLVSYGTPARAMRQAVADARAEGKLVSAFTLQTLWPVPEKALINAAEGTERVVIAELNHGQYRRELERVLPDKTIIGVHRVDGRPISPGEIAAQVL